jgi:UDP-N-acetylglucosamine 2-epimerase
MNGRITRVTSIVGARPQFIKAAAVSRAIVEHNKKSPDHPIVEKIVHTGQHYDENMSQIFFEELEIPPPDYNLGVGSGPHGKQTGKMLERIEDVLLKEKPYCVIVYGDTNSTLAGALAAAKLHTAIAHVEAGLRSFNRQMPEEINRVLTDHIATLLFCPTDTAVKNLEAEGITQGVHQVGDVMYDSILFYTRKAKAIESKTLKKLNIQSKSYYLATVHRAENTDDGVRLAHILEAFNEIATEDCPAILPLHPRTVGYVHKHGLTFGSNVKVTQPVSYLEMVALENNAKTILTDSGGVQKEAYFLGVPCITLRNETEWVETVKSGWNTLAGVDRQKIVDAVKKSENKPDRQHQTLYENGRSAEKICEILLESQ